MFFRGNYLWVVTDPLGAEVALKEETYKIHVIGDHPNDEAGVLVYPFVKDVISLPDRIYYDADYPEHDAVRYIDLVRVPEVGHIQALVVTVHRDRTPYTIASWQVKTSLKQETGGVIYDSRTYHK